MSQFGRNSQVNSLLLRNKPNRTKVELPNSDGRHTGICYFDETVQVPSRLSYSWYHGGRLLSEGQHAGSSLLLFINVGIFRQIFRCEPSPRAPLKMRKRIDAKFARYVPIWDKQAWNIIVKAVQVQKELFKTKRFGEDESNYLLFDGLTASKFYLDLKQAQERTKLQHRSPHKLRHTHLSWLYGEISEDPFLAEKIGGHRDKAALETYSHIREQLGQEQERQDISLDNLVEID